MIGQVRAAWMSALVFAFACFGAPVLAQISFFNYPASNYTSQTTRLTISDPEFSEISSLTNGSQTVLFDTPMQVFQAPDSWSTWGAPPNTESAAPTVLWTEGVETISLTLTSPVKTFGVEVEPDILTSIPVNAKFYSGSTFLGELTQDVNGDGGARLFAATSTSQFDRVVLNADGGFAIAQLRYSANTLPVPEASTAVLFGVAALATFAASRRRKRLDGRRST